MGLDVDKFGVGGGVAEGLHHQVSRETEAGEILQFVAGHGAGGVLASDRGHLRFAVGTRADALALGEAAGAADHLLRQREALAGIDRRLRQAEQRGGGQAKEFAGLAGQGAADDQVDAAAGTHFVE